MAINHATDLIAESFADIMMESVYVERLPDKLKNPLRAMLEASVREGFGIAETIVVDSGTVGPFAWVFPVLDRIQDVIDIHDAASGTVQARNDTLLSAALGAELNAELLAKYPSPQTRGVVDQWLVSTKETFRSISSAEEYEVLAATLDDGFAALVECKAVPVMPTARPQYTGSRPLDRLIRPALMRASSIPSKAPCA